MAKILLIEDDAAVRAVLCDTLLRFGHGVTQARNGKEGLALLAVAAPDLVITDIIMPEQEGLAVLLEVKTKWPAVKLIAMSGGGRQNPAEYLRLATFFGAARTLMKPFSNLVLSEAISAVLASSATGQRSSR